MRFFIPVFALVALAACNGPIESYHHAAAHPFAVQRAVVRLPLTNAASSAVAEYVGNFGLARPNNGSVFVITATRATADTAAQALLRTGVSARDIYIVDDARDVEVARRDLSASAENCYADPTRGMRGFYDDGLGHENTNAVLFGCAVRRNIAVMADDPRTLVTAAPSAGREGARAAVIYNAWVKGDATQSKATLPTTATTESNLSATGGGAPQ